MTEGAVPDPSCKSLASSISNPYYSMKPQPLLDRNGWYPVGLDFPYLSPNVLSVIVNYKRDKVRDHAGIDPESGRSIR